MDLEDHHAIVRSFNEAVNMAPAELETWLGTDDSHTVGWTHDGDAEASGHLAGARIVAIKRTRKADLTDDDYAHMRKVVGYVHRHMRSAPRAT